MNPKISIYQQRSKNQISFTKIGQDFIYEQIGRGNAEHTVKHYEQTIRKIKKFLCWLTDTDDKYDSLTDEKRYQIGGEQCAFIFDRNGFDAKFRRFLIEIEEVNDVTVTTYFRDYRVIAYWMMNLGYINSREIIIRKVEADVKEVYSSEEISKLLKKPKKGCSFAEYRNWVVIHHLLATGNRISTVCSLKLSDVDWEDSMLVIQKQKNKKKHRIPIEHEYMKVLEEYVSEWLVDSKGDYVCEYLFPSAYLNAEHENMSRSSMGKNIAAYNLSRGVTKTSTHLFRHTFAKNWIVSGKDLHSLQKILGHSTLAMVTHYANLYDTDLKDKVEDGSILQAHKRQKRNTGAKMVRSRR